MAVQGFPIPPDQEYAQRGEDCREKDDGREELYLPELNPQVLKACSFQNWFEAFKSVTFPSTIIQLDQDFIEYLSNTPNGLHLPQEVESSIASQLSDSEEGSDQGAESEEAGERLNQSYHFPQLTAAINRAISFHDGSVFPKLNWSAPQDAGFMLPSGDGLLRCRDARDVYMVLKSSDCIFHDLDILSKLSSQNCQTFERPTLVLRKWFNLNPALEFRCFVRSRNLIGVSARSRTYYDFLVAPAVRKAIIDRISTFFKLTLLPGFTLQDFIFDVYVINPTKTRPCSAQNLQPLKPNLKLVDINPFAYYVDSYLFNYNELDQLYHKAQASSSSLCSFPILKIVEMDPKNPGQIHYSKFSACQLPLEFLSLNHNQ